MGLTIGKLALAANVNVETVRYYQRVGLVAEPAKPANGYRTYPPGFVARIHFIKRAQKVGFTLKEIAELLALGGRRCDDIRLSAEKKRHHIDTQIRDLTVMRKALDDLIDACRKDSSVNHCSIINAFSDPNEDCG